MEHNSFLNKIVDNIFSLKKSQLVLIGIFFLGLILRIIAAINLGVYADDMHFVTHAINFFDSGRLITYDQSSGLWFVFTSFMYKLFGVTQLSSRIAAILFGSFSILAIYLLSKEFFNEKISLTAAFLLSIAPFHIRNTVAEMDVMTMFFVLMSMVFFVKACKNKTTLNFMISGLFIGLAIYTKVYPLLFVPSMILFFIYQEKSKKIKFKDMLSKKNMKLFFFFFLVIFLFCIPALTHNYLLYKDKGFLDLQFTRTFDLGKNVSEQYYGWDAQFNAKNSWTGLFFGDTKHIASGEPLFFGATKYILFGDPINFILGILGLILIFISKDEKKDYLILFITSIIFALPFLASIILLPKHFIFIEIFLIPASAFFLIKSIQKLKQNKNIKLIFVILVIFSLFYLGLIFPPDAKHFYGESSVSQMQKFKETSIPENNLIIMDSRFYRGRIHWAAHNRPYLEGSNFISLLNNNEIPGEPVPITVYYFECVTDDCGWGGIQDQPEFNQSMESLTNFFKENGEIVSRISEPSRSENYFPFIHEKQHTVTIYKATVNIKPAILTIANQPKQWFLYYIGYPDNLNDFDDYSTNIYIDYALKRIAQLIVLLSFLFSILSIFFVISLAFKNENNLNNSSSLQ